VLESCTSGVTGLEIRLVAVWLLNDDVGVVGLLLTGKYAVHLQCTSHKDIAVDCRSFVINHTNYRVAGL